MKVNWIIALFLLVVMASCRSTSTLTSVSSSESKSSVSDSTYVSEKVGVDTLDIAGDSVAIVIPGAWLSRQKDSTATVSLLWQDSVITRKSGRATVTAVRTAAGLKISASCDSVQKLLLSKTTEIYRLKKQADSLTREVLTSSEKKTFVPHIPMWIILSLVLSVTINAVLVFIVIKKRKNEEKYIKKGW